MSVMQSRALSTLCCRNFCTKAAKESGELDDVDVAAHRDGNVSKSHKFMPYIYITSQHGLYNPGYSHLGCLDSRKWAEVRK